MKTNQFDLVIIGSGPGGYVAAIRAAQSGLKTALIEKDQVLGGTCLNRGCIPTKALLHAASLYQQTKAAARFGIHTGRLRIDFNSINNYKKKVVEKLNKGIDHLMKKNEVHLFQGVGSLSAPGEVMVTTPDGKPRPLSARHTLLATGSVPRTAPGLDLDGDRLLSSDQALELSELPESLLIVGAGCVGIEFASIFGRLGSRVTLVEILARVAPGEDDDISKQLEKSLKKQGVKIRTATIVEKVETGNGSVDVLLKSVDDGMTTGLTVERVLVAVGRRPSIDGLGLEKLSLRTERSFIRVDETLRTSQPDVFAIGDVISTPALAHVASHEAIRAVDHLAGKRPRPINYDLTPRCIYCQPEVARVGLTERQARQRGYDVRVGMFPFSGLGKAAIEGASQGFVKVVSEARYGEILGVHLIGHRATELIAEGVALMSLESTVDELTGMMHAHPTLSECMMEAGRTVQQRAIHI